jgi:hypothetical protein
MYDSGDVRFSTTTYVRRPFRPTIRNNADITVAPRCPSQPNIGRSVVGVLRKPNETANRYVRVASFVVSQNELLAVIEKVAGEKFTIEHSTAKQMQVEGLEALKTYAMPGVLKLLVYGIFGEGNGADYALRKNDSALLGLESEDLEAVVRGIYKGQQQQS